MMEFKEFLLSHNSLTFSKKFRYLKLKHKPLIFALFNQMNAFKVMKIIVIKQNVNPSQFLRDICETFFFSFFFKETNADGLKMM